MNFYVGIGTSNYVENKFTRAELWSEQITIYEWGLEFYSAD